MALKEVSYSSSTMQEVSVQHKTTKSETKQEVKKETKTEVTSGIPQDEFVKSKEVDSKATYQKTTKLTQEQVQGIKEEQEATKLKMLQRMLQHNIKNQANAYGLSKDSQDLLIDIFGSIDEALPPLATTPEEAQKAIEEGGAYSIGAVADRIMKMAEALGGNDTEKIAKLRAAVEKGFKQAGMDFEKQMQSKLPQICFDTYDEVMKRFDVLEKKQIETME